MRKIELLAPAGNADIAVEAIKHGADAVYIGAPSHGARLSASNSLKDIARVVDFAHIFGAKVYVTVNTLVYENEIRSVERMIAGLYRIGVDALIVQDMGILRMDIPPIALHASTQCDIRTPEKAKFLEEAGFSQLVLARELSIKEIKDIADAVSIPIETFVHGALCVSYSGRCSAGFVCSGRSGNRGECPQVCRQAFTLRDADGKILAKDKYLLSLKDFRADNHLEALIDAGVSSFKIEGRLKETGYVKNVVAHYSSLLNDIICRSSFRSLVRESAGNVEYSFKPHLEKSFNRGFTDYRLSGKPDSGGIASIHTPKSMGEKITDIQDLRPGDGISFFDSKGEYSGIQVNGVKGGKIIGNRPFILPKGAEIRRTSSIEWKKLMAGETAKRLLAVDIEFDETGVTVFDERGSMIRLAHGLKGEPANKPMDYRRIFEKLGNTPFRLRRFENNTPGLFYPASALTALRRELIDKLLKAGKATYRFEYRRRENKEFPYPATTLDYRDNVANSLAEGFYKDHGIKEIERALETRKRQSLTAGSGRKSLPVMSTRHCILREMGLCLKSKPKIKMPLSMESGNLNFTPVFDCTKCEMHMKLNIKNYKF